MREFNIAKLQSISDDDLTTIYFIQPVILTEFIEQEINLKKPLALLLLKTRGINLFSGNLITFTYKLKLLILLLSDPIMLFQYLYTALTLRFNLIRYKQPDYIEAEKISPETQAYQFSDRENCKAVTLKLCKKGDFNLLKRSDFSQIDQVTLFYVLNTIFLFSRSDAVHLNNIPQKNKPELLLTILRKIKYPDTPSPTTNSQEDTFALIERLWESKEDVPYVTIAMIITLDELSSSDITEVCAAIKATEKLSELISFCRENVIDGQIPQSQPNTEVILALKKTIKLASNQSDDVTVKTIIKMLSIFDCPGHNQDLELIYVVIWLIIRKKTTEKALNILNSVYAKYQIGNDLTADDITYHQHHPQGIKEAIMQIALHADLCRISKTAQFEAQYRQILNPTPNDPAHRQTPLGQIRSTSFEELVSPTSSTSPSPRATPTLTRVGRS